MSLIIFDVDGVLEDKEILFAKRKEKLIETLSKKYDISFESAKTKFNDVKVQLKSKNKSSSVDVFTYFGFSKKEFYDVLNSVDPKGLISPNEGCYETIERLSKSHSLVAYSNTPHISLKKTLDILNVTKFFTKIYSSEDFTDAKPSLENLNHIISEQGFSKSDVFLVGDSTSKDIKPANDVGITSIYFNASNSFKNSVGKFNVSKLSELIGIIK